MASAELSRRVAKIVGYAPLCDMDAQQRRELHEALLDADAFEDLPREVAGGDRKGGAEPAAAARRQSPLGEADLGPGSRECSANPLPGGGATGRRGTNREQQGLTLEVVGGPGLPPDHEAFGDRELRLHWNVLRQLARLCPAKQEVPMLNDTAIARLCDAVRRHLDRRAALPLLERPLAGAVVAVQAASRRVELDVLMAESQQGVEIAAVERLGKPLDELHVG